MYSKELEQMLHSDDFSDRVTAAECGYGLDILVNDESPYVREEVARQGYGLDVLIHDTNPRVRAMVAYHGYGLDIIYEKDENSNNEDEDFKYKDLLMRFRLLLLSIKDTGVVLNRDIEFVE